MKTLCLMTTIALITVVKPLPEKQFFCKMNLLRQNSHLDGLIYLRNQTNAM